MTTFPVIDSFPIAVPNKITSPTVWTLIKFVVPDAPTGTPAVITTRSPLLISSASSAFSTDTAITSSVEWSRLVNTAFTPQLKASLLLIRSSVTAATIVSAGLNLDTILAVNPVAVAVKIADAPKSAAILHVA